jgi:3-oxoacyl-[acyl-carrier protein] reductase
MSELKGKVALITGGARGIGKTIVLEFARNGCQIAVSDVDLDGAQETAGEAQRLGVRAIAIKCDVTSKDNVDAMVKTITQAFGQIDILVNNAGITRDKLLIRMTENDWDSVIGVNLKGAFLCTKAVIPGMLKQHSGKIINMASVVGVGGNAGQANYAASKAGLIGFTKSVAKEAAARNVQANAIAPGYIETEMTAHLSEEVRTWFMNTTPAKRPGSPEDVARTALFLASKASDYITGQVIHVDGGMMMG